jgi:hypothetical protein
MQLRSEQRFGLDPIQRIRKALQRCCRLWPVSARRANAARVHRCSDAPVRRGAGRLDRSCIRELGDGHQTGCLGMSLASSNECDLLCDAQPGCSVCVATPDTVSLHMIDLSGDVTGNGISKLVFTILSAVAETEHDRIRDGWPK